MTDHEDPSRARDEIATQVASERAHTLANTVQKLTFDVHAFRAELATNTASTLEIVERQRVACGIIRDMQSEIAKVDFGKLSDMVDALDTMKGGVKVLGWLERPIKWIAAAAGAVLAIYSLIHAWGGK